MSRRATLKAAAAAAIMSPFLDAARRIPGGNARTGAHPLAGPADVDAKCNWSSAGLSCATALAETIATTGVCATAVTGVAIAACVAAALATAEEWQTCSQKLDCQCPAGSTSCLDRATADCCESDEVCVSVYGCMPPCDACSTRNSWGDCVSSCADSQTCCNSICTSECCCPAPNPDSDPYLCSSCDLCCPSDPVCLQPGSQCCYGCEDGYAWQCLVSEECCNGTEQCGTCCDTSSGYSCNSEGYCCNADGCIEGRPVSLNLS
jgi:hypothetical protein